MVRRTLEGTCREQGVKKRTLAASLQELKSQGRIDGMLADWAEALRVLGNLGAHYTGRTVDREDAEDSMAFAEALLDHLYVLRKRFEEFRARLKPSRECLHGANLTVGRPHLWANLTSPLQAS